MALASAALAILVWPASGWVDAAQAFVYSFLLLTGIWHYGLLAGMVACLVQEALPGAVTLLQTDSSEYRLSGVVLLAVACAPAALGWIAYRRFGRTLTMPQSVDRNDRL